jgi:hypothetical protein
MTVRKYSSVSIDTTLTAGGISDTATSMTVAVGTGTTLMGGITLSPGDIFTVAIDPDTVNEEVVYITARSGDSFTISREEAGTAGVVHAAGATVRHVLSSDDLNYFNQAIQSTTAPGFTPTLSGGNASAVSTQIQVRRDAAASWTSTNPTLASGEIGVETDTAKFKIGNGSSTWTGLPYSGGGPTTGTGASVLESNPTINSPVLLSPEERTTVTATAATGTVNFDVLSQAVLYYTSNATANWTLNVRGSSGATLNSILANGDAVTVVFLVTNGATPYYPTAYQIDGVAITPRWQGGTAPTAGSASSIDAYSLTIVKTSTSPTYVMLASQTRFA